MHIFFLMIMLLQGCIPSDDKSSELMVSKAASHVSLVRSSAEIERSFSASQRENTATVRESDSDLPKASCQPGQIFAPTYLQLPQCQEYLTLSLRCGCRNGEEETLAQCRTFLRNRVFEQGCFAADAKVTDEMLIAHCTGLVADLRNGLSETLASQCF